MAFVLMMVYVSSSSPSPWSRHHRMYGVMPETPENREASLQGARKRNYPSSSSCLRKHKTVILRFCCRSKHPSSRFQSQAINKMGKPKRGKECREEEERSGHGWGGSQSNEYLQLCLVYKCEICVGVKKRRGCHPSPAKTGE